MSTQEQNNSRSKLGMRATLLFAVLLSIASAITIGFVLGVLTGLSVSPVVSTIITSILALVGIALQSLNARSATNEHKNRNTSSTASSTELIDKSENNQPFPAINWKDTNSIANACFRSILLICGSIALYVGVFEGIKFRTTTQETPKRNLQTYYAAMGFKPEQIQAIIDNEANALAGRYRNLKQDCLDAGLTGEQTDAIMRQVVEAKALLPKRHQRGSELDENHQPRDSRAESAESNGLNKEKKTNNGHAESNSPKIDPRTPSVFNPSGTPWIGMLSSELMDRKISEQKGDGNTDVALEDAVIKAIRYSRFVANEAAELIYRNTGETSAEYAYFRGVIDYLEALLDSRNGSTWQERIARTKKQRDDLLTKRKALFSDSSDKTPQQP